ncbi:hypothetical protein BH20ACT9_BH20ACT9_04730 [soil metagenome]
MTGAPPSEAPPPRRRRGSAVLVGVAVALIAIGVFVAQSGEQRAVGGDASAGGRAGAPKVGFERFDGQPARLEDWRGRPLVVNFWASWCPPCVAEMRDAFEPLHDKLGDRVAFLGVNLQDTPTAAREVVERTRVTYELARDPDGALFTAFGGFGMPTTVLVDAEGRVVAQHAGALSDTELEALVADHFPGG